MAFSDLYQVSETLIALLKKNFTLINGTGSTLNVVSQPPEKVENPENTLSLYLYHVTEDPYYKNSTGPDDNPDISTAPMALCLFYILTAHHETNPEFDIKEQQKLISFGLKTFHDYPVIIDQTQIDGIHLLPTVLHGKGNSIQIILRPVSPEEAISFWNTEDARTARLSAYYEVRVIMLEPEPPKRIPGIVLSLGAFVYSMRAPYLECTQNSISFIIPTISGGGTQTLEPSPARVATQSVAGSASNQLFILGTDMTGESQSLIFRNTLWAQRHIDLGGSIKEIELDVELNTPHGWSQSFQTDRTTLDIAPQLRFINKEGVADQVDMVPGIYTVLVDVLHQEKELQGKTKQIRSRSNEVAFYVIPLIDVVTVMVDVMTITLESTFDLNQGVDIGGVTDERIELDIQVIVEGSVYLRHSDTTPLETGYFRINASSIELKLFSDYFEPGLKPIRVIVNGAESQPYWREVS